MATILLCLSCYNTMAQAPYKASIGGLLGYLGMGTSFKTFFTEHISFQTDIFGKLVLTMQADESNLGAALYPALELNTNVMYQKRIKERKKSELFWVIGGGLSLGCDLLHGNGKFGANVIIGWEYVFKNKPLAFQIDLRPGYGMLFNSGDILKEGLHPAINPWHHFDWLVGFTFRYAFKEKRLEQ